MSCELSVYIFSIVYVYRMREFLREANNSRASAPALAETMVVKLPGCATRWAFYTFIGGGACFMYSSASTEVAVVALAADIGHPLSA